MKIKQIPSILLTFGGILLIYFTSSYKKVDISDPGNKVSESDTPRLKVDSKKSLLNQITDLHDAPALVYSSSSQPDPSKIPPVIFYSPHQDDETIGMGASIAENVRLERPVYVVLLTNGANSNMLTYIQKKYNLNATMQNVITARNNEFIAACIALGVDRIYIANAGNGYDEVSVTNSNLKDEFKRTMLYMSTQYPNACSITVSGNCDSYGEKDSHGKNITFCNRHPTHQAAANAMYELYAAKIITDIKLYRVYSYYWNYYKTDGITNCFHPSDWLKPIEPADKIVKQKGIDEYKYVNIFIQRYGLAWNASVSELLNTSYNSDYEYVDYIQDDCGDHSM